jgi:ribosome biogenesis protein NSA1
MLEMLHQWKETRIKPEHTYIGLTISERFIHSWVPCQNAELLIPRGIYSCTSNGALRITPAGKDNDDLTPLLTVVPTRLCDWRLSSDQETFAYGGDEVDLSVWNTEKAFASHSGDLSTTAAAAKRRKRNDALFPGEVWRAKNVRSEIWPSGLSSCRWPTYHDRSRMISWACVSQYGLHP